MKYLAQLKSLQKEHPALKFRNPALIPASVPLAWPASHAVSWHDPWAERNAMLRALDIPQSWKDGLSSMSGMCPPDGVSEERWEVVFADVDYLAEHWATQAARLGWSALDLFGCSPGLARRLDRDGLAMRLNGRQVVVLTETIALIEVGGGRLHRFCRPNVTESVPLWRPDRRASKSSSLRGGMNQAA